jgi:hypothetical protein
MPRGEFPSDFSANIIINRSLFGESTAELLEDSQAIISAATRATIDIISQTAAGQTGVAYGALDPLNSKKFAQGEHFKFNPQIDPRMAFYNSVPPEVPNSIFNVIASETFESESVTGTKSFGQSGISGDSLSKVASANRAVLGAADKRRMGVLRRISSMFESIARKWIGLNALLLEEKDIIRITGESYSRIRVDSIQGRVDLAVKVASQAEDAMAANDLIMLAQTTGNSMPEETLNKLWAKIAELKKQPALAKDILTKPPTEVNPMLQRREELELQKLEVEIIERQSRATENEVDARLKSAKAELEIAKVKKLGIEMEGQAFQNESEKAGLNEDREDYVAERDAELASRGTPGQGVDEEAEIDAIVNSML